MPLCNGALSSTGDGIIKADRKTNSKRDNEPSITAPVFYIVVTRAQRDSAAGMPRYKLFSEIVEIRDMKETTKSEETRQRILHAALALFQAKGFTATTMREIAEHAGVAVGAAYHYFRSKEEIVFAYYAATQDEAEQAANNCVACQTDVKKRIEEILRFKLRQLQPYRSFMSVLGQSAVSPKNPLSPFSPETAELRARAVRIFELACEGSNLKIAKQLRPFVPRLLWFYEMGIIFFWMHDESPSQRRTDDLLGETLSILMRLFKLSALPLLRPINAQVARIITIIEGAYT